MTLIIDLPPDVERRLMEEADRRGQLAEELALSVLQDHLPDRTSDAGWPARIETLIAKAHANVAASGATQAELEADVRETCEAVRQAHHERRKAPT